MRKQLEKALQEQQANSELLEMVCIEKAKILMFQKKAYLDAGFTENEAIEFILNRL